MQSQCQLKRDHQNNINYVKNIFVNKIKIKRIEMIDLLWVKDDKIMLLVFNVIL